MTDTLERVERGAHLLTQYFEDPDWIWEIDTNTLAVEDAARCVLAQLWTAEWIQAGKPLGRWPYNFGRDALGLIDHGDAVHYGFDTNSESYRELNRTWKYYIHAARERAAQEVRA